MVDEKNADTFGKRDEDGNRVEQVPVMLKFEPNKPQEEFLKQMKQYNIFECHRRLGKTYLACMLLLVMGLSSPYKDARFALVSPEATQGERNVTDMIVEMAYQIPGIKYLKSKKELHLPNGPKIFLLGIKNEDSLRGGAWDGIVIDEFRDLTNAEYSWNSVIMPTLNRWHDTSRKGWIVITSTPPQKKHFYTDLFKLAETNENWTVLKYPITESGVYSEQQIEDLRSQHTPTAWAIEYMLSHTVPTEGAFFTESLMMAEEQGRIKDTYKYDPSRGVYASLDIGIDGTAIWFSQKVDDKYVLIDYYQDLNTDKQISHFINVLRSRPYVYNHIFLPHDTVKSSQITSRTVFGEFKAAFGNNVKLLKREPIDNGIFRCNSEFYKVCINSITCRDGLQALREYSPKKDSSKSSFTNKIDHNWASHGADSFRYMIKGLTEYRYVPSSNARSWITGDAPKKDFEPF